MSDFFSRRAAPFGGLLLATFSLAACAEKEAVEPTVLFCSTGLTGLSGTWKLTKVECRCLPTPLPDVTLFLNDSTFERYESQRLAANGRYARVDSSALLFCGTSGVGPKLRFTELPRPSAPGREYLTIYRLSGDTLVLDYSACDGPSSTYQRLK